MAAPVGLMIAGALIVGGIVWLLITLVFFAKQGSR